MSQSEPGTIVGLENLRRVYKEPRAAASLKALDRLDDFGKNFIALSPFFVLLLSTTDAGKWATDVARR